MPKTIVVNNREAIVIGQLPMTGKDTAGVPQLGGVLTFYPGVNLVDAIDLKRLRTNPQFEANFTTKIPRSAAPEHNPEKVGEYILIAGEEVPDKNPLAKLEPKRVTEIIEDTCMPSLLQAFLDNEGREGVRAAIYRRLELIKTGGAPMAAAGR